MSKTKEILALTKKLVRFKTTSDNIKEINKCTDFIVDYFKKNKGSIIKKYKIDKKPALVITFRKTKKPELFLVGHMDVVSGEKQQFIPKVRGNRLYGRGAADNKCVVATLMILMKEYSKQKEKPDIGLIFTSDEETSGKGIKTLIKKYKYRPKFALVPDGGSDYEIVVKEKGILRLKVSAKGRSAHGAYPWKGDNAIEKLMKAYFKIKKLFPKTTKADRWKVTLNLGKMFGGDVFNKVPDYAEMWLDIRYTEDTNVKNIINKIKKIKGIKVKVHDTANMLITDTKNKYIKALKQSVKKITKKSKLSFEHGASDARFFSEKKIPVALILPMCHNVHAENEYVEIKSLGIFYEIVKDFVDDNIKKI